MVSRRARALTAGFDLRENQDGRYHPLYTREGERVAELQLLEDGSERLWLRHPNAHLMEPSP